MFPVTDDLNTIADCLRELARKAGVQVQVGASMLTLEKTPSDGFRLEVRREAKVYHLRTKKLLIATGSDRRVLELVRPLGHTVNEPVPSLFTFNVKDARIDGLAGVSVNDVTLNMDTVTTRGALLITHWGLSGPAILRCSAWGARILSDKKYASPLIVNWLGDSPTEAALEVLTRNKEWKENARKKVSTTPAFSQIPLRLWKQLTRFIGEKNWGDVTKSEMRNLAGELTGGRFMIQGKGQFKEEFVTCGGVNLKEVDFKTMQSRVAAGLFFAGEVLDIDGLTGGFNFQSSWTTGWIAGSALSSP